MKVAKRWHPQVCKYPEKTAMRHARLSPLEVGECRDIILARANSKANARQTPHTPNQDWADRPRTALGMGTKRSGTSLDKAGSEHKKSKVAFAPMLGKPSLERMHLPLLNRARSHQALCFCLSFDQTI